MEERILDFWLKTQANLNPDKIAITDEERQVSFNELYEQSYELAQYLTQLNVSRIGLYISNTIESVILINACWIANLEIAMINTRLSIQEIKNQMSSVNIEYIITTIPLEIETFTTYSLDEIKSKFTQGNVIENFNLNHIASIMFTSGTTGPQKAVPQTFSNHLASAIGCKESLGYQQSSKWLSVLPIYHISGLSVILRSIIEGFTVRIVEKFNTVLMLDIIKKEAPTHVSLVPQTLKWLMNAGLNQPFSIEKILLGGAKLSQNLIDAALNYRLPIYNSFGMTETCSQFLTASPEMLKERYDTVGKPSHNVSVHIHRPNEEGHGELWLKGDNVMNGYLYPENVNEDAFEDGYFKTGDIAEIDEDGCVMIYDRRKDLIISGGENIYPYQIETIAKQFEHVSDAVCIGQSDETWGQIPILFYVSDANIDEAQFQSFLEENLAKFKVPKQLYRVTELPYTSTGKLQRQRLRTNKEN